MGLGANGAPLTDVASVISSISPGQQQQQLGLNGTSAVVPSPINPFGSPNVNPFAPPANVSQQPQPIQTPIAPPTAVYQQSTDHGIGSHFQSPPQASYQSQTTGGFFNPPQPTQQGGRPTPSGMHYVGGQFAAKQMANAAGGAFHSQSTPQSAPKVDIDQGRSYGE